MERGRLVSILIVLSSILLPVCYARWISVFLESFGNWLVFPWWIYDQRYHAFLMPWYNGFWGVFGLLWTFPILYTATTITLLANSELLRRGRERWGIGLSIASIVFIIQTIWPMLVFLVFSDASTPWPSISVNPIIPMPLSSAVALIGFAWIHTERRTTQS